jgi:hypothetical protein
MPLSAADAQGTMPTVLDTSAWRAPVTSAATPALGKIRTLFRGDTRAENVWIARKTSRPSSAGDEHWITRAAKFVEGAATRFTLSIARCRSRHSPLRAASYGPYRRCPAVIPRAGPGPMAKPMFISR